MIQTRHYINLTNGLESLAEMTNAGASISFLRLRSTTIERKDWAKLFLQDLSDDLLMHLALGWECIVHDRGTRRPLSKTISVAVPLVRYVLDRRWHGITSEPQILGPNGGSSTNDLVADLIYFEFFERSSRTHGQVRRRIDYYRQYVRQRLLPCPQGVRLLGESSSTEHDGDAAYYANIAALRGRP